MFFDTKEEYLLTSQTLFVIHDECLFLNKTCGKNRQIILLFQIIDSDESSYQVRFFTPC